MGVSENKLKRENNFFIKMNISLLHSVIKNTGQHTWLILPCIAGMLSFGILIFQWNAGT